MDNLTKCQNCENETKGYKCDMCNAEADNHDASHQCGSDHCMPKCTGCNEAEAKCPCGQ